MNSNPTAFWYATRGAGFVSLILLTAVMILGILVSTRWASERWPRFLSQDLHRYLSLTAMVFLVLHIVTAVIDPFAKLGIKDAVIPFASAYRPVWLGLGVVSVELGIALLVSSLLRARFSYRLWRTLHWGAYLCWPMALLHGLGTGTDSPTLWGAVLYAGCVVAVLVALTIRLSERAPGVPGMKAISGVTAAVGTVALVWWTFTGPMQNGWAKRAGTPASLLASSRQSSSSAQSSTGVQSASPPAPPSAAVPAGLELLVSGQAVQNTDGSVNIAMNDQNGSGYQFTVSLSADQSSLSLSVTRNGASLCSVPAQGEGEDVIAVCGRTQVTLALRVSDDGGFARGRVSTSQVSQ